MAEGIDSVGDGGNLWRFVGISGYGWIRLSIRQDTGLDVVPRNVRLRDGRTRTGTAPAPLSRSVPERHRAQPGFPGPLHLLAHDGSIRTPRARRDGAAGAAPVDLIIADYRLGEGATGSDAIQALCAHIGHSVPAVIVTGDTSPSRIKEATASGYRILHKPIAGEELHEAIVAACVKEAIDSGC